MTADLENFKDYYQRLDKLIAESTKDDVAECARVLAVNVAHYKSKYGDLPLEEHNAMLEVDDIDEELAKLVASGTLEMISVLALVTGRSDGSEEADAQIH